jgi:hypothetical protein
MERKGKRPRSHAEVHALEVEDVLMTKIKAAMLAGASVVAGVLIGAFWTAESAHAQVSRFRTERQGELLFIRYANSVNGVQCPRNGRHRNPRGPM